MGASFRKEFLYEKTSPTNIIADFVLFVKSFLKKVPPLMEAEGFLRGLHNEKNIPEATQHETTNLSVLPIY